MSLTGSESTTTLVSTTSFNATDFPLSYWHCHSAVPDGVLIASSFISGVLSLVLLNAAFGAACAFSHKDLTRMFNAVEKFVIVFQYLIAMPAFELFVIWGPSLTIGINHNSSSSVVSWIAVNSLSLFFALASIFASARYRALMHVAQCMRAPMAIVFFCDRAINFSVGVEGVFITFVFIGGFIEMIYVHQYLAPSLQARTARRMRIAARAASAAAALASGTFPTPRNAAESGVEMHAQNRNSAMATAASATTTTMMMTSSAETTQSRKRRKAARRAGFTSLMGNGMPSTPRPYRNDEEEEEEEEESVHTGFGETARTIPPPPPPVVVTQQQRPQPEVEFDSDVPPDVRRAILADRRHKKVSEGMAHISGLSGNASARTIVRAATQLRDALRKPDESALGRTGASSASMSEAGGATARDESIESDF